MDTRTTTAVNMDSSERDAREAVLRQEQIALMRENNKKRAEITANEARLMEIRKEILELLKVEVTK